MSGRTSLTAMEAHLARRRLAAGHDPALIARDLRAPEALVRQLGTPHRGAVLISTPMVRPPDSVVYGPPDAQPEPMEPPVTDAPKPKPLLIIVGADKGGVGKTTIANAVADYVDHMRLPHDDFDTEHPRGGYVRFRPGTPVVDVSSIEGQMAVFDNIRGITIVDVRAGMLSELLRLLDNARLLEDVREDRMDMAIVHILGPTIQSLGEVHEVRLAIGGGSQHFMVKNHASEKVGYFSWTNHPDPRIGELLKKLEPKTMTIPHLETLAAEKIDLDAVPFRQFLADRQRYGRTLCGYVETWLYQVWAEIDRVGLGRMIASAGQQAAASAALAGQ